jgi:hypothetical protein
MLLVCGQWRESGGTIYLTGRVASEWDCYGGTMSPSGGYLEDGITPKDQSPWRSSPDYTIKNITIYEEGTHTSTSDRVFVPSEWEGVPNSEDNPVPILHYRELMPTGHIRDAFDYINP